MTEPEFTPEFNRALKRVIKDFEINGENESDLVAVGIKRSDCVLLVKMVCEDEPKIARHLLNDDETIAAVLVLTQWAVATGVWIERKRWENP
jgi:hypothetical protein